MARYIKVNNNGEIVAVIISNDPTLSVKAPAKLIDVSSLEDFESINKFPYHFVVTDKGIVKKSKKERDEEDEKRKPPTRRGDGNILEAINKITDNLKLIENRLTELENKKPGVS